LLKKGDVRPKNLKKCIKLNWNFQRDGKGRSLEKKPSFAELGYHKKKDGGCTFYQLANQTKPTKAYGKIWFNGSCSYTNSIALDEFE